MYAYNFCCEFCVLYETSHALKYDIVFLPILSHVLCARYGNETVAAEFGGKWELRPKFIERNFLSLVRRLLAPKRKTNFSVHLYWLFATSYFYSTTFNRTVGHVRTLPTRKCCVPTKHYPCSADVFRSTQMSGRFFQYDSYSRCISHSALNQGLEAASSIYRWRLCESNFISHILWITLRKQLLQN